MEYEEPRGSTTRHPVNVGLDAARERGGPEGPRESERQSDSRASPVPELLPILVAFFVWSLHGVRRTLWFNRRMSSEHPVRRPEGGPEQTECRRGIFGSGILPEPRTIPFIELPPSQVAFVSSGCD
jgi:hypothetical protein